MTKPLRHLLTLSFFLALSLTFVSCSTIDQIKRDNKDLVLDTTNFNKLEGRYSNGIGLLSNLNYRQSLPTTLKVDSVTLIVKTLGKKSIRLDFESNGKIIKTYKLRGKYKNGYFATIPKFSISLLPLFPVLWGPGTYNLSLGLTKESNLVYLESHGGIAFFLVLPVFGSGAESGHEIKRLN